MIDDQNQEYDTPYNQQPQPQGPTFDTVNGWYQKYLNRPLSQDEYQQFWAGRPDANESMVANSPEGIALINKNVPGTPEYDPNTPVAPANQTGQRPPGGDPVEPPPPPPQNPGPSAPPPVLNLGNDTPTPKAEPPPGAAPPTGGTGAPTPAAGPNATQAYTPPPPLVAPPPFQYQDFSYADYKAPDVNDFYNSPDFQLSLKTGTDAINRSAAARGVLNTGGTLADIMGYGQDLAKAGWSNYLDRDLNKYQTNRANEFGNYTTNRNNAFQNYTTNYGIGKDVYDTNVQDQYQVPQAYNYARDMDIFNANQHNYDQDLYYSTHKSDLDRQYAYNNQLFNYNVNRNNKLDDFDMRYKLLGLV